MIMNIGDNIKRIREDKGMTQQQVADLVNMHRSNYSKWKADNGSFLLLP